MDAAAEWEIVLEVTKLDATRRARACNTQDAK